MQANRHALARSGLRRLEAEHACVNANGPGVRGPGGPHSELPRARRMAERGPRYAVPVDDRGTALAPPAADGPYIVGARATHAIQVLNGVARHALPRLAIVMKCGAFCSDSPDVRGIRAPDAQQARGGRTVDPAYAGGGQLKNHAAFSDRLCAIDSGAPHRAERERSPARNLHPARAVPAKQRSSVASCPRSVR